MKRIFLFLLWTAALVVIGAPPPDELMETWLRQDGGLPKGKAEAEYRKDCLARRAKRLKGVADFSRRWTYCRHYVMGGSHYAYTEALSDAQNERTYLAIGSSLCLAEYTPDGLWRETVLLESKEGCFRDVDVSPDGTRLLYSFKASDRGDDFHLWEYDLANKKARQLTFGKGIADYEGCYLPDGRILFNSTRCMQIVDCWWTEVSNLYRCEADGSNIRRITFDQVHDNYPALTADGRVLYTRWEYNDRSQMYPQPLFGMNVDGTNQRAVYGGNSWFPTTLIHARAVPGSSLLFGIATGHHSLQPGELMRFDLREGSEEAAGAWQLAPLRRAKAVRIDAYGQGGRVAAYPYPVNDHEVVLSYLPEGWRRNKQGRVLYRDHRAPFGLYWTDVDGGYELLVSQRGKVPCGRPVPVHARKLANRSSVRPDETLTTGTFAIQNVYEGAAMKGVPKGTVKTLRAVSVDYRPAGIGWNSNGGPGGGGLSCTAPALGQGTWGVKRVLGEVPVADDGSVFFEAPACTPIYFMLLDEKGRMVQSMRSWTMLQPGENASCIGCHEPPGQTPDFRASRAGGAPPLKLKRPDGVPPEQAKGFSFLREIQPILDRRCVACHSPAGNTKICDLTSAPVRDERSKRQWTRSYVALTHARAHGQGDRMAWSGNPDHPMLNWISSGSVPTPHPPLTRGSRTSRLLSEKLDKGHARGLTDAELRLFACWIDLGIPFCGDYEEANLWNDADRARWKGCCEKRRAGKTAGEGLPTGCPEFEVELPRATNRPVVKAVDFGFSETNEHNASAINAALAEAKRVGACRVELAPGVYRCFEDGRGVVIDGFEDFTFDGKGATLVFRRDHAPLQTQAELLENAGNVEVRNCRRTVVENFNMDWDWENDPLAVWCTCVGKHVDDSDNASYADFELEKPHPKYPRHVPVQLLTPMAADKSGARMDGTRGPRGYFGMSLGHVGTKSEWLSPTRLRVWPYVRPDYGFVTKESANRYKPKNNVGLVKAIDVGGTFTISHCYYGLNGIVLTSNRHFTLRNVDVWACRGLGVETRGAQKWWQLVNVNVRPKPGCRYPVTSTADAHHVVQSQGFGKMVGCEVTMHQDDHFNYHDRTQIAQTRGLRTVEVVNNRGVAYTLFAVGTEIGLKQEDFSDTGWTGRIVGIDGERITFDRDLPPQKGMLFVLVDKSYATENFMFKDCRFHGAPWSRGIVQGNNVTFDGCTFGPMIGTPLRFISCYTYTSWCEGIGCSNVVVRNCRFENCLAVPAGPDAPQILVSMQIPPDYWPLKFDPITHAAFAKEVADAVASGRKIPPAVDAISDILIERNTFVNPRGCLLSIENASRVTFRDNAVERTDVPWKPLPCAGKIQVKGGRDNAVPAN